jgi:hypothetical protein
MAAKSLNPEIIRVIRSKRRNLEIDYDYNVCSIRIGEEFDYKSIGLNENEAKKLHKALSKFIELRDALRKDF